MPAAWPAFNSKPRSLSTTVPVLGAATVIFSTFKLLRGAGSTTLAGVSSIAVSVSLRRR